MLKALGVTEINILFNSKTYRRNIVDNAKRVETSGDQMANDLLISPRDSTIFHESMLVTIRTFWCKKKLL